MRLRGYDPGAKKEKFECSSAFSTIKTTTKRSAKPDTNLNLLPDGTRK